MKLIRNYILNLYREWKNRFINLFNVLGSKFLCVTILIEHIIQGFLFGGGGSGIVISPLIFMLKEYKLTASKIQILRPIAILPWSIKPLIGIISDTLYIGGYNKIPYILFTTVIGIISCVLLVLLYPFENPLVLIGLIFFCSLQIASSDLFNEAKYVEKCTENPEIKPDLMTFIHLVSSLFQLVSVIIVGILIKNIPLNYMYLFPIIPFLILLYPIYYNWIEDNEYQYKEEVVGLNDRRVDKVTLKNNYLTNIFYHYGWIIIKKYENPKLHKEKSEEVIIPLVGVDLNKIKENWKCFLLALMIGIISIFNAFLGGLGFSTLTLFISSIVTSLFMILSFFLLLDKTIAKIQTFVVIQNMCSISLEGASFFFYTDNKSQYPNGPHFSIFFYVSVMGLLAIVISFIGILSYNLFMQHWKYRKVFLFTNLFYIVVSLTTIIFIKRWNLIIGIPDVVFVLGSEALQVMMAIWSNMPSSIIMLSLCPKDIESTMFSILAGSSNLGGSLSNYMGAFLLEQLNINPIGGNFDESVQFNNLWIAYLISSLTPIIPLFFIYFLIPDAYQTDDLLNYDENQRKKERKKERRTKKIRDRST